MTELNDNELLAQYTRDHSEAAFATLVARYVNLVYSAALRYTGNPHQAEEITQAVYIILARKAASLRLQPGTTLSGWLYQTARLTAANFVKSEIRRHRREQEAYMQSTMSQPDVSPWEQIGPLLDEAMGSLGETDRNAIVLHYFENKTTQEVAANLRLNEAAVYKRLSRALEKLRTCFLKRGVALSVPVIAEAITTHSVQAAPTGLGVTVAASAAMGVAVGGSTMTLVKGVLSMMVWTKAKLAIGIAAGTLLCVGSSVWGLEEMKARQAYAGTTHMRLTGTTGASFVGFYVQDGQKRLLSNTVPWSFAGARISSFEFHKLHREDTVVVSLDYEGNGVFAKMTKPLDAEWLWMQGRIQNGLLTQTFPK